MLDPEIWGAKEDKQIFDESCWCDQCDEAGIYECSTCEIMEMV